jgi:hypothetical protein
MQRVHWVKLHVNHLPFGGNLIGHMDELLGGNVPFPMHHINAAGRADFTVPKACAVLHGFCIHVYFLLLLRRVSLTS